MSTKVTETLQFNCTTCPSECLLTVEVERDANGAVVEVRSVTGNSCPRGDKFAHQELTCPMRVLTTTVAVSGGDEALLKPSRWRSTPKPWPSSAAWSSKPPSAWATSCWRTSSTPTSTSSPAWTSTEPKQLIRDGALLATFACTFAKLAMPRSVPRCRHKRNVPMCRAWDTMVAP